MIQFSRVDGTVIVTDLERGYEQAAWGNMELDTNGNYLIVTTGTSSATILVNGSELNLPHSAFLRIRNDRTWWDRYYETFTGDFKTFIGRLWAKISKDIRDPGGGNPAIGIRG